MTVLSYPAFVEGQTLTRDDLNGLRDYLRDRDRTLGRTLGFGIGGGLTGSVDTTGLHLQPGLAVDQLGEALLMAEEQLIPVPPTPDAVTFDFVSGTDGFTVVLVRTDHFEPTTPCTEAGCSGHAELHDTGVDLVVVAGRLVPDHVDFSQETLLTTVTPLTLTANGNVSGAFVGLLNAIVARIGARLKPALAAKLAAMKLETNDLTAVKAYKAAFLNQVLFATLDLLRFESLISQATLRDTATPGVALGWLHQVGGVWTWDCSFRHHWEPTTGLTLALLGGSCSEPGLPWLQRLESLIDTFTLPPVPAPADPPKPIDPGDVFVCKNWKNQWIHDDCSVLVYPPTEIKPDWPDHWTDPGDLFQYPPPWTDPVPDYAVYEIDPADSLDLGAIDLYGTFGTPADDARDILAALIEGTGVTAGIDIVDVGDVRTIPGFQYTGAVGAGDRVVLVKDALGKVVTTGRVSAGQTMREIGTTFPAVTADAAAAVEVATTLHREVATLGDTVGQHVTELQELVEFQTLSTTWRAGVDQRLSGLGGELAGYANQQVARLQVDLSAQLPGIVAGSVKDIREELQGATGRIDVLYGRSIDKSGFSDRESAVNTGLLEVLRTMRGSVETLAPDNQREEVRSRMASVDDGLARLDAATRSGGSVLADSPETLSVVVDSLIEGLQLAGAPADTVKALRVQSRALTSALNR